jgi:nitroreductase
MSLFPAAPAANEPMPELTGLAAVRDFLALRRSSPKLALGGAGPEGEALEAILRTGLRVPDHGKLGPWRLIVVAGDARERLADAVLARFRELHPDVPDGDARLVEARGLVLRAPVVVFVVSSPVVGHKIPVWEQELSAGALCHQLVMAAQAAGFGAVWLSEWISYDAGVAEILGLSGAERVAGKILIGAAGARATERPRPALAERLSVWTGV